MQSFQETLEYVVEAFKDLPQRFRGGVEDGLEAARAAALNDGVEWDDDEVYQALLTELEGLMQARLGAGDDGGQMQPRAGSIAWYIERHHEPLVPGIPLTVLQACYQVMFLKHYRGLNEVGTDELCGLVAVGGMLNEGNLMPRCCPMLKLSLRALCLRALRALCLRAHSCIRVTPGVLLPFSCLRSADFSDLLQIFSPGEGRVGHPKCRDLQP